MISDVLSDRERKKKCEREEEKGRNRSKESIQLRKRILEIER